MPLYWLCYRLNNQISIVIEPSASLIHARMRAAITELDEGTFTEGHELDRKWRVPKEMIGRRLSLRQAKKSLAKFERVTHRPLAADLPWRMKTVSPWAASAFSDTLGNRPTASRFVYSNCDFVAGGSLIALARQSWRFAPPRCTRLRP